MVRGDDLDQAWDSVPSSPPVKALDPIDQLKRLFRGAIAANPSLWRSVNLEDGVLALDELARTRPTPLSPIPLEGVKKRLVRMHAPRTALLESFLAFADEAKAIGVVTILPPDIAALDGEHQKQLLRGFYARVNAGGLGAMTRSRALAGELIILTPPARSTRLAQAMAGALLLGIVLIAIDDHDDGDRPRPAALSMPDDGVRCAELQTHGRVIRCVVDEDGVTALRARPSHEQRQVLTRSRSAVLGAGYADLLVVDQTGLPITARSR